MDEDEKIKELLENNRRLIRDVMDPISKARYDNLRSIREHIHHYVLLSLAILGFTVPVLADHPAIISNFFFLICSMCALVVIVVYGMWYLTHILQKDNNDLTRRFWVYSNLVLARRLSLDKVIEERTPEAFNSFVEAGRNLMNEAGYEEAVEEQKNPTNITKKPTDYSLDVIFWLFIISIVFYILSLIPFQGVLNQNSERVQDGKNHFNMPNLRYHSRT